VHKKIWKVLALLVIIALTFTSFVVFAATGENGQKINPGIGEPKYDMVRFAVFGDTRQYVGGDPVPEVTKRILKEISWISPDFAVQTGDIDIGQETEEYQTYAAFLDYKRLMQKMGVPFFVVPGNHDLYPKGAADGIFEKVWGPFYYYFDYKGSRFVFMNSEIYEGDMQVSGGFGKEQIDWLKNVLDDAQSKNLTVFVFMHRPLYVQDYYGNCKVNDETGTRGFAGKEDERDEVINILNSHSNVKYVFAGHKHMYYYCSIGKGKPVYVTVGNGGAPLYGTHWRGAWYGYLIVYYDPQNPQKAFFDIYQPWHYVDVEYYPGNDGTFPTVKAHLMERLYMGAHEPTVYGNVEFIMPPADKYEVQKSFNASGEVIGKENLPSGAVRVHVKTYLKGFRLGDLEGYNITLKAIGVEKNWKPKKLLATNISLTIDGQKFSCPVPLRVLDGHLMVPINCLDTNFLSYLGSDFQPPMKAQWQRLHDRIEFQRGRFHTIVWYDYPQWIKNNKYQPDGAPTFITTDDTYTINVDGTGIYAYMWVKDLASIYGRSVEWNGETRTVVVK